MKSVLLHICCGPCAIYPFETLRELGFSVECFFYNPNIQPEEEYLRRKKAVEDFYSLFGIKTYFGDYNQEAYLSYRGNVLDKDYRCKSCFRFRLKKTHQFALDKGFDFFTTTLLVSPYQNQQSIKEAGFELSLDSTTQFLFYDFRDGYRYGHAKAKELNFYHQKYCGCLLSLEERNQEKRIKQAKIC